MEMNSARAAFMLAETYDWRMLRSWRARGVKGDVSTALQLYRRAANGGVEPAKERMVELDTEARRKPAGN
jgi:TPR repeat protein